MHKDVGKTPINDIQGEHKDVGITPTNENTGQHKDVGVTPIDETGILGSLRGKVPAQAKHFGGTAGVLKKKLEDFDKNVECIRLSCLRQGSGMGSSDDVDFPVEDLESPLVIPKVADFMRDESR